MTAFAFVSESITEAKTLAGTSGGAPSPHYGIDERLANSIVVLTMLLTTDIHLFGRMMQMVLTTCSDCEVSESRLNACNSTVFGDLASCTCCAESDVSSCALRINIINAIAIQHKLTRRTIFALAPNASERLSRAYRQAGTILEQLPSFGTLSTGGSRSSLTNLPPVTKACSY